MNRLICKSVVLVIHCKYKTCEICHDTRLKQVHDKKYNENKTMSRWNKRQIFNMISSIA